MDTHPRIIIPKSVKHDHDELRDLIGFGMGELEWHTEVHVKARNVRFRWEASRRLPDGGFATHGGSRAFLVGRYGVENVRKMTRWDTYLTSGRAYRDVPSIANVAAGTRWLVTLTVPNPDAYACMSFPHEDVYAGKRDSRVVWPRIMLTGWRDDVVAVAAHEACHVLQFGAGDSCSELGAERYAFARLAEWHEALVSSHA